MLPQLVYKNILIDIRLVQIRLKLLVKCFELLAILDHRIDRIILEFLGGLQLSGVFRQDANPLLAVLIVIIGTVDGAANKTQDDDQKIYLEH